MTKTAAILFTLCVISFSRGYCEEDPQSVKLVAEVKEYGDYSYRLEVEYEDSPKESFLHPGCVIGLFVMPAAAASAPAFEDLKVIAVISSVGETVKVDGKYVSRPVKFTGRANLKKVSIDTAEDAEAVCTSEYYEEASDDEVAALEEFLENHFGETDENGDITPAQVRVKRLDGQKVKFTILRKRDLSV